MVILFKISFLAISTALATGVSPSPVSTKFVGNWKQTADCEMHPLMKGDMKITAAKPKNLLLIERPNSNGAHNFNAPYVVTEKDKEGVEYRTTVETEAFKNGEKLISASIWKKTSPP